MRDPIRTCKKCGRQVFVITWGVYRKVLVDAEAVAVKANAYGKEYVRADGSKVLAREAKPEEVCTEYAYRQHRCEVDA